jgi:hypothetical protein
MFGDLLIQIPVYRCSREDFFAEEDERLAPYVAMFDGTDARLRAEQLAGHRTWDYNAVVAWIEVDAYRDMVKVYACETQAKRVTKHPQERAAFGPRCKISEHWWRYGDSNEAFVRRVRTAIVHEGERLAHGTRHKRYVDLTAFDQITRRIDWQATFAS